jgi:hypothetical protein
MTIICLLSTSTSNVRAAEAEPVCTPCSDPTHIMNDEKARFFFPIGSTTGISCLDLSKLAAQGGVFSDCSQVHALSSAYCKCGVEELPFMCPLCGYEDTNEDTDEDNGMNVKEPKILPEKRRVVAGKTCEEWEDHATNYAPPVDCPHYQKSLGSYCGCDITSSESSSNEPIDFFEGFCKLCGDSLLPDYNKQVTFVDESREYCVKLELDVNIYERNCVEKQNKFHDVCGCSSIGNSLPTLAPSSNNDSAGAHMSTSISMRRLVPLLLPSIIWFWGLD